MLNITQTKYYSLRENAFSLNYLRSLERQIVASTYLGNSQLNNFFAGSKGFSVLFHNSEINRVVQKFPFFKTYIDTALSSKYNVFYLNPLVLEAGGVVKPHVDCSLSDYFQSRTIPKVVSVLYVKVPSDLQGGELILARKEGRIGAIKPQENTLLYFMGSLNHSVSKVITSQTRISLVCEQYALGETQLQKIPKFKIESGTY